MWYNDKRQTGVPHISAGSARRAMNEMLKDWIKQIKIFLLDMDGTIYIGDKPIGGMSETLAAIRASGRKVVYCTNNSSRTADEYVQKLKKIGLYGEGDEIYTSSMATIGYLNSLYRNKRVYVCATEAVKAEFAAGGIHLTEEDPDVCVLAYDTELTYAKLEKMNRFLVKGAVYIATHPDDVCPAPEVYKPDVGSFIQLLRCSSGREPDVICGKPFQVMGEAILNRYHVSPEQIVMVGDRPHTDIRFGKNNDFHTILVLSGETDAHKAETLPESDTPGVVLQSLNDVVGEL